MARAASTAATILGIGLALCSGAASADTLYAIRPDRSGAAREFSAIVPTGPGTDLGDGSLVFNGGLAYSSAMGSMVAVATGPSGASYLTSFKLASPSALTSLVALGTGFNGGLAYDTDTKSLYAIASDASGASTLYTVGARGAVALGALGTGFIGGLTYDSADHAFYAMVASDATTAGSTGSFAAAASGSVSPSKVCRIGLLDGVPDVEALFDLGGGGTAGRAAARAEGGIDFLGGIVWNPATGGFLTFATDGDGTSAVYSFTLNGEPTLTRVASVGSVFSNIGLAYAPDASPLSAVPEPSTMALLAAGGALLLLVRRRA